MKAFVVVVVTVTIVSIIWASFRDAIDPNSSSYSALARDVREEGEWPKIGQDAKNIFWMVQVSDIHISKFRDLNRGPDLVNFCREYLQIIQPQLVLITGDLTDSKDADDRRSGQFRDEWKMYHQSIEHCRSMVPTTFLDTRGNHDAFDVSEVSGIDNFYRNYSVMGQQHALSYHYQHQTAFGKYSFIAVDACPIPGSRRPFNFFGYLDDVRMNQLMELDMVSRGSNLTIWFGHYPTSIIVNGIPGIRHVMRNGVAYLCGHLHTLGDLLPKIYSRQKTGTLELELGDWKINRKFRVLAVDHDLLSFVDAKLGEWPIVLITNPKDAQFLTVSHEPVESIWQSTHIRILVFSHETVSDVHVYIDKDYLGQATHGAGPLFTLPWEPQFIGAGLHTIRVDVMTNSETVTKVEQLFSVDGSMPDFAFWPRFLLMMNIFTVGKVTYCLIVCGYILVMATLRQCHRIEMFTIPGDNCLSWLVNKWVMWLWLVAQTGNIYYPLMGFILYVTFGPWFVGDFLTNHTGVLFIWGTFVKGTFIPGSLAFFYGIFQVLSFNAPLTLFLGKALDARRQQMTIEYSSTCSHRPKGWQTIVSNLPFSLLLVFQIYIALTEFPRNYGTSALLISPVRGGSVILAVILLYVVNNTPFRRLCSVAGCISCK